MVSPALRLLAIIPAVLAVTFTNLNEDNSFLNYAGGISERKIGELEHLEALVNITYRDYWDRDHNVYGLRGLALFDYDGDRDLDLFVSSPAGFPNFLYQNQLEQTGELEFVNIAERAGVAGTAKENNGACFGDIDNDGDLDLFVVSEFGENDGDDGSYLGSTLYENNGDGSFTDISLSSGVRAATIVKSAGAECAFGDVDGDGLVDITIAYVSVTWEYCFSTDKDAEYNQLLMNQGNNKFSDETHERGVDTWAAMTWAVSMVDYDMDGDLDIFNADDQCGDLDPARGFIRILQNDGNGYFTDVTAEKSSPVWGAYMNLAFADVNNDGTIDIGTTDLGSYGDNLFFHSFETIIPFPNDRRSRWMLNDGNGAYYEVDTGPNVGSTPFGWGGAMFDFDNSGTTDYVFDGGLNSFSPVMDNPGVMLLNTDGYGNFAYDGNARSSLYHLLRMTHGLVAGDLNKDGFLDIVTVSEKDHLEQDLVPYGVAFQGPGKIRLPGEIQDFAPQMGFVPMMQGMPVPGRGLTWTGAVNWRDGANGSLSMEINSGERVDDSDDGSDTCSSTAPLRASTFVRAVGTVGITEYGRSSRDGIGAIIKLTPKDSDITQMLPVTGGCSHTSQHPLHRHFGLGSARSGYVEVFWPNGKTHNCLHNIRASTEDVIFPEIPCDFKSQSLSPRAFRRCVRESLDDVIAAEILSRREAGKFEESMLKCYSEEHQEEFPTDTNAHREKRKRRRWSEYPGNRRN